MYVCILIIYKYPGTTSPDLVLSDDRIQVLRQNCICMHLEEPNSIITVYP